VATVFGAYGFLGRYVVFKLGGIGSQCVVPYRGDGENCRHLKLAGDVGQVVPVPCSMLEEDDIRRAVARSNVVINLLGSNNETRNYSFDDANVKTAFRIAKVCSEFPNIQRFVHVSGMGADVDSDSSWCRSKGEGEEVVRDFFPDATILRPAPMWGNEDKMLGKIADCTNWFPFLPTVNDGKQKIQPVAANDVGQAIVSALASTESQGKTYELAGPDVITHSELLRLVADEIYHDSQIVSLPDPVAETLGKVFEKLPKRWQFFSQDQARMMKKDMVAKGKLPGLQELLIEPTSLTDDIGRLLIRHRGIRGPPRLSGMMGAPMRHPNNRLGDLGTAPMPISQSALKGHGW